nr:twin-arginine translocase subunit TatC [Methanopyrus sp. KOL6]
MHPASVCVGGYTGDVEKLSSLYSTVRSRLESMQSFLESVIPTFWKYLSAYLPDDVGDRPAHMISSGTPFYSGLTSGYVHPYLATSGGVLIADTKDQGSVERARLVPFYHDRVGKIKLARGSNLNERCYSYSEVGYYEWNGTKYACEAGPLARLAVAYKAGDENVRWFLDSWSEKLDVEVWGLLKPCARNRNMARILEALLLTRLALHWIDDLPTTGSTYKDPSRRSGCFGTGVIEAPRGTLIHKVSIGSDGKVVGYEIITPTNLNHAPIEESMVGERVYIDEKLAAVKRQVSESERLLLGDACRAARSFNPCNSCASHTIVKVVKRGWTNSRSPPLRYHVEELRKRVLRSLVAVALASSVAFPYSDEMLRRAVHELVPNTVRVIVTGPIEPLWARLELSLLVGLLVTLPYLIYEGYRYIRPALYKEEACVVRYMLPCSYLLFLIGATFSYIVLKVSIRVLYSFAPGVGAEPFTSLEEFVSFVVTVIFIMGIVFQLPLITYLAARSGLIDPETLKRRRKEVCGGTDDSRRSHPRPYPVYASAGIGPSTAPLRGRGANREKWGEKRMIGGLGTSELPLILAVILLLVRPEEASRTGTCDRGGGRGVQASAAARRVGVGG